MSWKYISTDTNAWKYASTDINAWKYVSTDVLLPVISDQFAFMYDFASPTIDASGMVTKIEDANNSADYFKSSAVLGDVTKGFNCCKFNNHGSLEGLDVSQHNFGTNDIYIILHFLIYAHTEDVNIGLIEIGSPEGMQLQYRTSNGRVFFFVNDGTNNKYVYNTVGNSSFLDGNIHTLEIKWTRPSNPTLYLDDVELTELGTIDFTDSDDINPASVSVVGSFGNTTTCFYGFISFFGMQFSIPDASDIIDVKSILNERSLSTWRTHSFLTVPIKNHGSKFTAIVGEEFKLYKDSFINQPLGTYVTASYSCDIGGIDGNGDFVATPVAGNIGSHDLIVTIEDSGGNILAAERADLDVIAGENGSGTKKILMIGESTTAGKVSYYDVGISAVLDHLTIEYLGTQEYEGYKHEGYSGKTSYWLVNDSDSPFVKAGVVDIPAYFADNSIDTPDFVHIMLGINDAFQLFSDVPTYDELYAMVGYYNELIVPLLAYDANIQIIISLSITAEGTGAGWAASYGETRDSGLYMHRMLYMRQFLAAYYDYYNYNSRVTVCYSGLFVDRINDYYTTNAVHPKPEAYEDLGKAIAFEMERLLV
jgi:lysophospholipase L1-like esterase